MFALLPVVQCSVRSGILSGALTVSVEGAAAGRAPSTRKRGFSKGREGNMGESGEDSRVFSLRTMPKTSEMGRRMGLCGLLEKRVTAVKMSCSCFNHLW